MFHISFADGLPSDWDCRCRAQLIRREALRTVEDKSPDWLARTNEIHIVPGDSIQCLVFRIHWLTKPVCRPLLSKFPISGRNQFSLLLSSPPHLADEDGGGGRVCSLIEKYESSFLSSLRLLLKPVCAKVEYLLFWSYDGPCVHTHTHVLLLSATSQLFSRSSINNLVIGCPRVKFQAVLIIHKCSLDWTCYNISIFSFCYSK